MYKNFWEMFKPLYSIDVFQGYNDKDLKLLHEIFGVIPKELENYYKTAGRTNEFNNVQDTWILPEHFERWKWLQDTEYMILLNENQGVCRAGIHKEDLCLSNPPVYYTKDDKNWILCAPATIDFLAAALAYEAIFSFEYSPEEFYWLNEEEVDLINSKLTKFPYELTNWAGGMTITMYNNENDNMVAIMDCGNGNPSMLYGAATEISYIRLEKALEGIGEPM